MNVDGRTIRQTILDTRLRGYDVGQVDELLEKIAHAMDVLDAANRELWRKNKELEHRLTRPEHQTNE